MPVVPTFILLLWIVPALMSQDAGQKTTINLIAEDQSATYHFIGSEMMLPGKTVKGAPYSATAVTTTTRTLADGNRIVHQSRSTVYRDSEGRTRRDQMLPAIGPYAPESSEVQLISISDPVSGVSYSLYPKSKTGDRHITTSVALVTEGEKGGPIKLNAHASVQEGSTAITISETGAKLAHVGPGEAWHLEKVEEEALQKEPLGTQVIEGVTAEGTRTVRTIAPGAIGNERPIEIVTETWYSPELQVDVMKRHNDPRSGETLYRLTEISREEPDHSLFRIPPDYKVEEGKSHIVIKKAKAAAKP